MATRSQPHGTRWLKFGSIQMIKAVCTVATVTKEIVLSAQQQGGRRAVPDPLTSRNPIRAAPPAFAKQRRRANFQ